MVMIFSPVYQRSNGPTHYILEIGNCTAKVYRKMIPQSIITRTEFVDMFLQGSLQTSQIDTESDGETPYLSNS